MPYKKYPVAKYCNVTSENYSIKQEDSSVPWAALDPRVPDKDPDPKFGQHFSHRVRVEKGDCLYLPSLWFHHVSQSHGCIAVNYWYDMEFDVKYCYFQMLQQICTSVIE